MKIPNDLIIKATPIAVKTNVMVARIGVFSNEAVPQIPWPEVHPLDNAVPNPTSIPPKNNLILLISVINIS